VRLSLLARFISVRTKGDNGYVAMADKMMELARAGFLGVESASDQLKLLFHTVQDMESIRQWSA